RCEGAEPGGGGRAPPVPRARGLLQGRPHRPARAVFRDGPAPRLAGRAVLVVDDRATPPLRGRGRFPAQAPTCPAGLPHLLAVRRDGAVGNLCRLTCAPRENERRVHRSDLSILVSPLAGERV